jgi:hypothetical protein
MNDQVHITASLENVVRRKDGSCKIVFETAELNDEKASKLFGIQKGWNHLIYAIAGAEVEIPNEPAKEFRDDKSPSERLRAVLFVYWKQLGGTGSFNEFYKSKIDKWIDAIKERLEPAA